MCKFGLVSGQETLRIGNCKLFTRGFTNKGIGITFNQDIGQNLYKMSDNIDVIRKTALVNEEKSVLNMKQAENGLQSRSSENGKTSVWHY